MASKEVVEELNNDPGIFKRREYGIWKNIIEICHDKSHPKYKSFGATGIEVCQLWREKKGSRGYLHFIGDMGFAPDKNHTLRRLKPREDFKPSNCIWFTKEDVPQKDASDKISIKIIIKDDGIFSHLK